MYKPSNHNGASLKAKIQMVSVQKIRCGNYQGSAANLRVSLLVSPQFFYDRIFERSLVYGLMFEVNNAGPYHGVFPPFAARYSYIN